MSKYSSAPGKIFTLLILSGILALPACAMTGEKPKPAGSTTFEQMDTNNDGQVVLEEFRTAFPNMNEKAFVVIDKNKNSGIERAEWYEFIENHSKGMKAPMKRDGMQMNNIPGDPLIPPPDSNDLPLVRPPADM